ncbi:MAG: hypothetical protein V3R51_04930 [Gammaproteobacteria bacterium]
MNKMMFILVVLLTLPWNNLTAYPLYGSEDRGIGRLEQARLAHEGVIPGRKKISGELLSLEQVDLRMLDRKDFKLPKPDPEFTRKIVKLLGGNASRYGVAVLDLSDPEHPLYAEHNGEMPQNPGSVGKIVVGTAIFQALADIYPRSVKKREAMLRETMITADEFIHWDEHKVRMWNPQTRRLTRRPIKLGDQATLWVWLDWMLSASSNAAAATCMEHAMLMVHYGKDYPVSSAEAKRFFAETPKSKLRDLAVRTFQEPLTRNGINLEQLRQGSIFTSTGKKKVPGTRSYATAKELMNFLLRLEQGLIIDEFSSREIKRMLYMTERRIRYASSPALRDAAVYFKSGSLYSCAPEEGFKCKKYHGNKYNYMNSIAIVESPAENPRHYYLVTLLSNVLRRNSAVDHQTFATRVHRIIEKLHPVEPPPAETSRQ